MQEKINTANTVMGEVCRSFAYLNKDMLNKLYKALVHSHLEYANPVNKDVSHVYKPMG